MRLLVLGAGGIGGYFGGRLAQAGADVTFLVREARAARLAADGLVIASPLGDATVPVATVTTSTLAGAYDAILLSCKAYDLASAIDAIRPAVSAATTIVPLLNGLAHVEKLEAAFGAEAVLGGLAHISTTLAPDGRILHLGQLQSVTYGARSPDQEERCNALDALFAIALFDAKRSADILQDMWEKFSFITAAAAITGMMRASVGHILEARDGERLTRQMLGECEAVAAAAGRAIRPKSQEWARSMLVRPGSDFTASMLRDIRAGAAIEADHLQGDMIRRGEAAGVDVTLLRVAYAQFQAYQAGRPRR